MASPSKIILISIDGKRFEVEKAAALLSQTLKNMIDDDCAEGGIPISNVSGEILAKVIEYCNKHAESSEDDDLRAWDTEFVKVDESTLLELVSAANYLDIPDLLDRTCQAVAKMIEDKSPEEVRELFNITNDFTPEEEEAIRKENAWAFE